MQEHDSLLKIGLPVTLLIIVLAIWIFIIVEIKRKRLEIKDIVLWFTLNIIFTVSVFYIMVINILDYFNLVKPEANIFNWIAYHAFGMEFAGQEWIILVIIIFLAFVIGQVMSLMVKVQKLHKRVDDLNKEVAVLSGKVNKTANFDKVKVASNTKTAKEIKQELNEKIKIAKAKKKAQTKMKTITQTSEISLGRKKN